MRIRTILPSLIALALAAAPARAGRAPFFPMGVWYEGGAGAMRDNLIPDNPKLAAARYLRDFKDIAAHGVNAVVVPNSPPEHHKILLDAAKKAHLRVILELGAAGGPLGEMIRGSRPYSEDEVTKTLEDRLKPIAGHPALWRVQLLDEPPADAFGRYGRVAAALRVAAPGLEPFCCLIGSGDFDGFLTASQSNVAAFDCYPIGPASPEGDLAPLQNFADQARLAGLACARNNADAYAVIQAHAIPGGLRFPTPGEMRCMTYSALATGSRGVFWFLYQSEWWNKEKGEMMDGLVDSQYRARPLWGEVTRLTSEIRPLAAALADLRPDPAPGVVECEQSVRLLRDGANHPYVFVVNMDTKSAQTVHVRMRVENGSSRVSRVGSKAKLHPRVEAGWLTFTDSLPPGGGGLYEIRVRLAGSR
ncbi:MAG TPA: hypothetical protein VGM37_19750 [Armatimonadota bacterium]|jgi:hypothetical protein